MIKHVKRLLTWRKLSALTEVPEFLQSILEDECRRLGIDPKVIVGIYPYRQCSMVEPIGNGKYVIKIYCGIDDSKRYTRFGARRELRHELRHLKDFLEGKEPSELRATLYEWFTPIIWFLKRG